MLPEIIVDKARNLSETLAARFEAEGRPALASRGRFAVALPGGSVAGAFFPALASRAFDWARTEFFWGDERAVPPSDPESNYAAAHALWLEPARVPAERIHRMPADAADLERAAGGYAEEMIRVLGQPPRLDLVLLGVGPDGHVCSLFPGHALLQEEQRWVAAIHDSPKPPPRRLTLTLPALALAGLVVVVAMGESKAEVIRESLEQADSQLPLALVARRARQVVFLLDPDAARGIAP